MMEEIMNDDRMQMGAPEPDIIHQLKNRLTVVKGVAQLLDRHVQRDDWQRDKIVERIDQLQTEIAQLEELIVSYASTDNTLLDSRSDDAIH
jgi:nitrogen-specific signal transduction histidine kinase